MTEHGMTPIWIGCNRSSEPRRLQRLQEFQQTLPDEVRNIIASLYDNKGTLTAWLKVEPSPRARQIARDLGAAWENQFNEALCEVYASDATLLLQMPEEPLHDDESPELRAQTLRLTLDAWRQLKAVAFDEECPTHDLLIEGVNEIFRKRGLPQIATAPPPGSTVTARRAKSPTGESA